MFLEALECLRLLLRQPATQRHKLSLAMTGGPKQIKPGHRLEAEVADVRLPNGYETPEQIYRLGR